MPNNTPMNELPPDGLSTNGPQQIWKNQITEVFKMSADQLRHKAEQQQRTARFEVAKSIISGLIGFGIFAWAFARSHEVIPRAGWGVLSLWGIYFAYQAYQRIWPGRLAPDSTLNATLQSYRSELEKQRDYVRHIWHRAGLSLVLFGVAMVIAPALVKSFEAPRMLLSVAPVFVLFAIWCAIFFPRRKRSQKKLQQEIEELCQFERESHS